MIKRWFCFILSILLVYGILASAEVVPTQTGEDFVMLNEEEVQTLMTMLDESEKALPEGDEFRIAVKPDDLSVREGLNADWQHILLMGTDTGNKKLNMGRTDAMLIASINEKTHELKLTSLVRDMLVDIPGMKTQNRINTANAFGGPLLAIKTVNEVLGLNISRYASINFSGFSTLIDALGGVEIELSAGEANELQVGRADGPQYLNGEQALKYVRIRKLDNNFGRNERQRKLLDALLTKARGSGLNQMMELIPQAVELVSTNLSTMEIIGLLPTLLSGAHEMSTLSLPQEGAFHFYQTKAGASVVTFDLEAVRQEFFAFIGDAVEAEKF